MESQYLGAEKTDVVVSEHSFSQGQVSKRTCYTFSVVLNLVTIHTDFMTANNGFEAVLLAETLGNIRAELHTNTALAGAAAGLLLGVGPQHLHHQAGLTWLPLVVSVEFTNVLQSNIVVREETTVKDEVLVADESC